MKILTFGKYKGEEISKIAKEDPSYILWAEQNVEWFRFDDDIIATAKTNLRRKFQEEKERRFNEYRKDKIAEICGFFNPKAYSWEDECVLEDEFGGWANEFW